MEVVLNCGLIDYFTSIQDLRDARWKRHLLIDLLVIALCAVLCGADDWEDIEVFGRSHREWFKQ